MKNCCKKEMRMVLLTKATEYKLMDDFDDEDDDEDDDDFEIPRKFPEPRVTYIN